MAGFRVNLVVVMALMLASMHFHGTAAQTTHVVGDALGWTIPSAGASAYTNWASRQTFTVGDILLFNFTTGQHNVAEVAQAAYGPCTTANPISIATTGPARVTLNAAGTHYYICTVGTHCQIGQKLTINVSAAASATPAPAPATPAPAPTTTSPPTTTPTPAPSTTIPPPTSSPAPSPSEASPPSPPTSGLSPSGSTTPSPTGSTTPSPTGSTTAPPPPNSAAPSFTAIVPVTFLAMTLAFFY